MSRGGGDFDTGECGRKASGGIVSFADGFTIHTFTDVDAHATFAIDRDDLTRVEVLVVGGGGGGGFDKGAGGDGGEVSIAVRETRSRWSRDKRSTSSSARGARGVPPPTPREATAATSFARSANSILGENHVIVAAGGAGGSSSDGAGRGRRGRRRLRRLDVPGAADSPPCFPPRASPRRSRAAAWACHVQYCTTGSATGGDSDTRRARTGRATRFPTRAAAAAASNWTTRAPEVGVAPTASSSCDTRDGALMERDGSRGSYSHSRAFIRPRRSRRVYE